MTTSDVLIIGAGPGGYNTAVEALHKGLSVTLVERGELGGTCLNRGCIPTKCFCRSADAALTLADASRLGVAPEPIVPSVNMERVIARKDEVVTQLREGIAMLLKGVNIVLGEAQFVDASTVEVNGETYTAPKVIVATGSRPAALDIPGAEYALTSDQLLTWNDFVPESLIIIGGGVIGIEFASIFAAFGSKVTVIEYCKEILPPFDSEIAKRLRMSLKRRGIDIVTGARVTAIDTPEWTVTYESKGKTQSVSATAVVMAVGRRPVIPEGLDKIVKEWNRGAIVVDNTMKVPGTDGLYAVGDVNGRCMLAHAAEAQGLVALGHADVNLGVIPSAVFSVPECSMVGMTEEQCRESGLNFKVGKSFMRANGKALAMDEPDGLVKILVDADSRLILGCHVVGAHAADIIQEVATVIAASLTIDAVTTSIHAHPTLSEAVLAAAKAVG